jgi:N utilization substance protein B
MIDLLIEEASEHWALYRMPPVDRAITRIGAWEVLCNGDVPDSVAINEAVSLAKEFGGDDSSKFVNGVLGKVAELKEMKQKETNND